MLSKIMIILFGTLAMFAILMQTMPAEFYYAASYPESDQQIIKTFTLANVTIYNSLGTDNMTHPYSSLEDGPDPPDWEVIEMPDHYLEVWWSEIWGDRILELRHAWLAYGGYYYNWEILKISYVNGTRVRWGGYVDMIRKQELLAAWDTSKNYSIFNIGGAITSNILLTPMPGKTIGEGWDDGDLGYSVTYEWNANATAFNIFNIVGGLFTFNAIDLHIGGIGGTIMNACFNIPLTAALYFVIIKITLAIIPFIPGLQGD